MPLCKCAMDLEWTEEMYGMEHHPQCKREDGETDPSGALLSVTDLLANGQVRPPSEPFRFPVTAIEQPSPGRPDPFESDEAMLAACERAAAFWNIRIYPEMGTRSTGATGEPFITLALGGEVAEADSAKFCATGERIARERFIEEFYSFCRDRADVSARPVLYWREKPNLQTHHCSCCGYDRFTYQVWARCLISTKPILPATESSSSASR